MERARDLTSRGHHDLNPYRTESAAGAHEPARPAWRCRTCDEEWPCRRRRALLRAESGGSKMHLAVALAPYFAAATTERPDISPAIFHIRFLGWFDDPR